MTVSQLNVSSHCGLCACTNNPLLLPMLLSLRILALMLVLMLMLMLMLQAQVSAAMAGMPRALSGQGDSLAVVYRKGGATKKLHWP